MLSIWTKGSKDKESLELAIRNQFNSTIVKRFVELRKEQLEELNTPTPSDLDDPNWANKEAFRQGRVVEILNDLKLFQETR